MSGTQTPAPWITTEEFRAEPSFEDQHYLINGEVFDDMGNTHPAHEILTARLVRALNFLLPPSAATVFSETAYELGKATLLMPDISLQIPEWPCPSSGYFKGAPQVAIEILSPSNTVQELQRKACLYYELGASSVWIFDPENREAFTVRRQGSGFTPTKITCTVTSAQECIHLVL